MGGSYGGGTGGGGGGKWEVEFNPALGRPVMTYKEDFSTRSHVALLPTGTPRPWPYENAAELRKDVQNQNVGHPHPAFEPIRAQEPARHPGAAMRESSNGLNHEIVILIVGALVGFMVALGAMRIHEKHPVPETFTIEAQDR